MRDELMNSAKTRICIFPQLDTFDAFFILSESVHAFLSYSPFIASVIQPISSLSSILYNLSELVPQHKGLQHYCTDMVDPNKLGKIAKQSLWNTSDLWCLYPSAGVTSFKDRDQDCFEGSGPKIKESLGAAKGRRTS